MPTRPTRSSWVWPVLLSRKPRRTWTASASRARPRRVQDRDASAKGDKIDPVPAQMASYLACLCVRERKAYQHSTKRLFSDPNPPARLLRARSSPSSAARWPASRAVGPFRTRGNAEGKEVEVEVDQVDEVARGRGRSRGRGRTKEGITCRNYGRHDSSALRGEP